MIVEVHQLNGMVVLDGGIFSVERGVCALVIKEVVGSMIMLYGRTNTKIPKQ